MDPVSGKIRVGLGTVIGILGIIGGAIPLVVRLLEEGAKGLTLAGPEKYAAILMIVSAAVTQLGRYFQAAAQAHAVAGKTTEAELTVPPVGPGGSVE